MTINQFGIFYDPEHHPSGTLLGFNESFKFDFEETISEEIKKLILPIGQFFADSIFTLPEEFRNSEKYQNAMKAYREINKITKRNKIVSYINMGTMNYEDPFSWNLYRKESSIGRFVYFFAIIFCCMSLMRGLQPDASILNWMVFFILSSLFAGCMQLRNFVFCDLWIGMIYRIFFIVSFGVCVDVTFTFFGGVSVKNFYSAFILVSCFSLVIGFIASIPFMLISYFLGNFEESSDNIYELKIPDYAYPIYTYEHMSRLELERKQLEAIKNENYEEAQVIQKILEKQDGTRNKRN